MKKKLIKIFTIVTSITILSSISVVASSNKEIKEKIQELTKEFNKKRENLEKDDTYRTDTEEAKEINKLGIQISDLREKIKTEDEYRQELEEFIEGTKLGLYDTKKEQEESYDEHRQEFIDKMEAKLSRIESEMKANDVKKEKRLSKSKSSTSETDLQEDLETPSGYSYKELLEQLEDRSDVD